MIWPAPLTLLTIGSMTEQLWICPACGAGECEEGFIDEVGSGAVRWLEGPVEYTAMGNTKSSGTRQRIVRALRCTACTRLEIFAGRKP